MPRKFTVVTAFSGSGKSFTGDYLATYCGFVHVDGDSRLHSLHIPANKKLADGLFQAYLKYWLVEKPAPEELWKPYFQALCDDALEAARTCSADQKLVVLSFSVYRREARDFIRQQLGPSDVTFVKLECDMDVLVRGMMAREEADMEQHGMTMEAHWRDSKFGETWGDYCLENYRRKEMAVGRLRGFEPIGVDEPSTFIVDATDRDSSTLDRLHQVLSLPVRAWEVDSARVASINQARLAAVQDNLAVHRQAAVVVEEAPATTAEVHL